MQIGADGINSPVRSFAHIDSLGWDYDAHGVVATLKLDPERPNNTAWQRFLPTGPIAMLPVNEKIFEKCNARFFNSFCLVLA